MIPYLLAAIGGYLIGNSLSTSSNQYAKGGKTDSQDILDISKLKRFEVTYVPNYDVTKMMQLKRKLIIALDENDVKKQLGSKAKVLKIQEKYSDGGMMDEGELKHIDTIRYEGEEDVFVKELIKSDGTRVYVLSFYFYPVKSMDDVCNSLRKLDYIQSVRKDDNRKEIIIETKKGYTWSGTSHIRIKDLIAEELFA